MSDEMNQIINQAKSQARDEKMKKFFAENKKLIKGAAVAVLSVIVIFLVITITQNIRQKQLSEVLHQSLVDQQLGKMEEAKKSLQKIHDTTLAPSGVWSIASARYAAFLLNDGKVKEALDVYREINECNLCDTYVKDIAGLLMVRIWMSDDNEMKKDDLGARIEKIENSSKPLKHQVAEQRAIFEMKKGNLEKSYQIFEMIENSDDVLPPLKERAKLGLRMVMDKGFEPKSKDKKQPESKKSEENSAEKPAAK